MLGRRQLREKAMQSIYAWKMSGKLADPRIVEKNMMKGVNEIYDLYIYLLNLLKFQKEIALNKIEVAKVKNFPTEQDLNPNLKFVENPIFRFLDENNELNSYTEKNKQLVWDNLENDYPKKIFNKIISSDEYQKYMSDTENSFEKDRAFVVDIYEKHIATSDYLAEWLEDRSIHWSDDFHIGNSMVIATLKSFIPKSNPSFNLFKVFKDDEDREFLTRLFRNTINDDDTTRKMIDDKAKNWDLDRIATLDLIILQMALTEFHCFKNVPPKVILNEYIELSKIYSTDNSHVFVNGILDKVIKETQRF